MRVRLTPTLFTVTVAAAALVAAGCGSSSPGSTSASSRAEPTTTSTRAASKADDRIARAGLLTRADLPDGFEPVSQGVTDFDTVLLRADRCKRFRKLATAPAAREVSPGFVRTNGITSNTVKVYDIAATPVAQIALLEDPKVTDCIGEVALRTIRQENGVEYDASVSPLAVDPVGDDALGFRTTVVVTTTEAGVETETSTEYLDEITVRVGRATMVLRVVTDDIAEAAEIETNALPKIADRLAAAQG